MIYYHFGRRNRMGGIGCLLFAILALIATFYVLKWMFTLLFYVSPVLFVLTLLVRPAVVRDAFRWLAGVYRQNTLTGIFYTLLGVLAFPVVALSLFLNAMRTEPAEREKQQAESEYVDFEEIGSEPLKTKEAEKMPE